MNNALNMLLILFNVAKEDIYIDWMGFKITESNPISAHHIKRRNECGEDTYDNIAILSTLSHRYLHEQIEIYAPDIYNEINNDLIKINKSRKMPTIEDIGYIQELMYRFEENYKKILEEDLNNNYYNEKVIKRLTEGVNILNPHDFRNILQNGIDPLYRRNKNVKMLKHKKRRGTDIY